MTFSISGYQEKKLNNPEILGRSEEDNAPDVRASTRLLHTVSVPFEGGAIGKLSVSVFQSNDDEDRGGLVMRITLQNEGSSFLPVARDIEDGVELHMAGDIEARSLVHALKTALSTIDA